MNLIEQLENEQLAKLTANKTVPEFSAGDTIRVNVKVVEGNRERVQAFEGVCIARKNAGINSSFTVRKISYGEGVERIFPLYSPRIDSIEIMRRGKVRRAKLYYLRGRTGKAARIAERTTGRVGKAKTSIPIPEDQVPATAEEAIESGSAPIAAPVPESTPETKGAETKGGETGEQKSE